MNEPTPLTPETVDALLSAELDGDFEAAARDLGLDAPAARGQLDATPGVDDRRAALARARDLIASRPRVETSVADRQVTTALAADDLTAGRDRRRHRERQWRILVATGSVAAAIAVIVGIASMSTTSSSNPKASSAATTAGQKSADAEIGGVRTNSPTSSTVAFGDISDASSLRIQAKQVLKAAATNQDTTKSVVPAQTAAGPEVPAASGAVSYGADALAAQSGSPACTPARLRSYNLPAQPALIASGTVNGARVVILIYDGNPTAYAYVIRVSDCALVRKQPLA